MRVLVTGAAGFIGKNLVSHLKTLENVEIVEFLRADEITSIPEKLEGVDFVFHLAGVNRPLNEEDFLTGNHSLTKSLCESIGREKRIIPILYTSSSQAKNDNAYGQSKHLAEMELLDLTKATDSPVYIYQLPNVFGKWCKPNYNSVVATFCYNIVHDLPIQIHDASTELSLVYIDDVINDFIGVMQELPAAGYRSVVPCYQTTVGEIAEKLKYFKQSRGGQPVARVGAGLDRALYSTYISYYSPEQFSYPLSIHSDSRGQFVEFLKTMDSGQFSYFTAYPGVTRGGHYHQTKTEKFLVIQGTARFRFRHIDNGDSFELTTSGDKPEVVETIPGWWHDITNIGSNEMLVMLWANEAFDPDRPDTYTKDFQ